MMHEKPRNNQLQRAESSIANERYTMRVLTIQEKQVFHAAYQNIMRVASVPAESIIEIKDGGGPLPGVYFDLLHHFGDMKGLVATFCPMNEFAAKQALINYCFECRIQPREFQFKGLLSIEKRFIPHVEHTYAAHVEEIAS
ncbi:hypothetical protein WCX49_11840 [Sulfurimonas sp. HSL-1656]|uniref:hypothetical protein n=1 Tax=Thiomicrolovo subterrani TaxID=3131934 RepID=UPI0031F7C470